MCGGWVKLCTVGKCTCPSVHLILRILMFMLSFFLLISISHPHSNIPILLPYLPSSIFTTFYTQSLKEKKLFLPIVSISLLSSWSPLTISAHFYTFFEGGTVAANFQQCLLVFLCYVCEGLSELHRSFLLWSLWSHPWWSTFYLHNSPYAFVSLASVPRGHPWYPPSQGKLTLKRLARLTQCFTHLLYFLTQKP